MFYCGIFQQHYSTVYISTALYQTHLSSFSSIPNLFPSSPTYSRCTHLRPPSGDRCWNPHIPHTYVSSHVTLPSHILTLTLTHIHPQTHKTLKHKKIPPRINPSVGYSASVPLLRPSNTGTNPTPIITPPSRISFPSGSSLRNSHPNPRVR